MVAKRAGGTLMPRYSDYGWGFVVLYAADGSSSMWQMTRTDWLANRPHAMTWLRAGRRYLIVGWDGGEIAGTTTVTEPTTGEVYTAATGLKHAGGYATVYELTEGVSGGAFRAGLEALPF